MSISYRKNLDTCLGGVVKVLKGKIDPYDFRNTILGLIAYKYLSEKLRSFEGSKEEALDHIGLFLEEEQQFHYLAGLGRDFKIEYLTPVLSLIENSPMATENATEGVHIFEDVDLSAPKLGATQPARDLLVARVLRQLDGLQFDLSSTDSDILGDAYEYLMNKFSSSTGQRFGEYYTPQEVSKVLSSIVSEVKGIKSVYDPTCGSGSLLLGVAKHLDQDVTFCGQELNRTTYNLAKLNMILHGVNYKNLNIKRGDTLTDPQHLGLKFDAIVSNPPYSVPWDPSGDILFDPRFSRCGKVAPKSKADYAFIQHVVHHLSDKGIAAVVMPLGVLFRENAEGYIRKYLINKLNCLDAVIGLPENIFYGTTIPTCILVYKKTRGDKDSILFIDSSRDFGKKGPYNYLRPEDQEKILNTYLKEEELEGYSRRVPISEIKSNDFNLNIPRYIDSAPGEEELEHPDVIAEKLQALKAERLANEANISGYCKELGIKDPF